MKPAPKLASLERRLAAKFVDLLICAGVVLGIVFLNDIRYLDDAWMILSLFLVILYWLLGDSMNGQSFGKRLFSLKVIDFRHGCSCTPIQSIIRNLAGLSWLRILQIAEEYDAIAAGTYTGQIVIDIRPSASMPVNESSGLDAQADRPRASIDLAGIGDFVRKRKEQNREPSSHAS